MFESHGYVHVGTLDADENLIVFVASFSQWFEGVYEFVL
jgi:hypothetical protein